MKRSFVIIGLVVISVLAIVTVYLVSGDKKPTTQTTPTPEVSLSPSRPPEVHKSAEEAHEEEGRSNPLLARLPYGNPDFYLTFDGDGGDKYLLLATIYYRGAANPTEAIVQKKPAVEAYIRSTGQPDGTYIVNYTAQRVESD